MTIMDILSQLQGSYGKPNMMTLHTNNMLFRSPMTPGDSPEMLFYQLEQRQEIQRIGKLPYSDEQIIANAVHILEMSNIFPLKRNLTHGRQQPPRRTRPSRRSSIKRTAGASPPSNFATRRAKMGTETIPFIMRLKMARKTPMMIR
jgi:hypothetical protein